MSAPDPARLGARDAYRSALWRLETPIEEAERGAEIPGQSEYVATYTAAKRDTLRRIAASLEQRMKECDR